MPTSRGPKTREHPATSPPVLRKGHPGATSRLPLSTVAARRIRTHPQRRRCGNRSGRQEQQARTKRDVYSTLVTELDPFVAFYKVPEKRAVALDLCDRLLKFLTISEWVAMNGTDIKWEYSAPYVHSQNTIAEQGQRTIVTHVQAVLIEYNDNIPHELWAEIIDYYPIQDLIWPLAQCSITNARSALPLGS